MTSATRACPSCATPLPDEAQFCLHCGRATPSEPGVPGRTAATGNLEVAKVRGALAERYKVERMLGEGGMATVYLAEDLKHHRQVAVKVMRSELAATLGADRFLREVEIAGRLSHPHILPMYDSGEAQGFLYYVMPYVEGETLQARLSRESQLPIEEAIGIAREVTEALAYAHERGIVHRDIKPANILLSTGHALVADFGIARAVGAEGEALTRTGLAIGTPQYMSPEQASGGRDVDGRTDVYAVGSMLYEMLAGEPPFTGPNVQVIISRSLTEVPRPLTATRQGLPPQLSALVTRALAKSPADRFPTAKAMADALRGILEGARSGAAEVAVSEGPSPLLVWGLFGLAAAGMLAMVVRLRSQWGLPAWSLGLAVLLLAIGAGVLILTGRLEQRRRGGTVPTGLARLFTWRNAVAGGVAALGLWAVVATAVVMRGTGAGGGDGIRLAVLPFENRGSGEDAYFADGIADEVRGKLTGLPGFRVTARSSSDQYRQTTKALRQIGSELSVDYLLTATVRWARTPDGKGRVQVVPELIKAQTGEAAWQQTFDADVTDVFQVQTAIASKVAAALGVALGTAAEQRLAERPTDNLAAYDLYLKGQALTSNDPNTLRQKAGFLDQAVALDPQFAEAWGWLAATLANLYFNGTPDPAVAARAKAAAEHALAVGKDRAHGHWGMALYRSSVLKDIAGANEEMTLALQAAPNDPDILRGAANLEAALGRWDQAISHTEAAHRIDPRSVPVARSLTDLYLNTRQYDKALAMANDALALAPADPASIEELAMVHLARGDLAAARAVIANAPGSLARPDLLAYLANYNDLYWVLTDEDQQLLLRLPASSFFDDQSIKALVFTQTYWLRGDKAKARAYADTSQAVQANELRGAPQDAQRHVLRGLALAYMGRKEEAIAEGLRGTALEPLSRSAQNGAYYQHQLVRIYLLVGEPEKALDQLEPLLQVPYWLSPGWLRIDPTFAPLKGNPRFEKLVK